MKRTPTLLLTLLLILAATSAEAQRIRGFVSSGLTLSQIEGDELKGFTKWGYTGGVGAIASLDRYNDWRISIEALFSQRGSYNNTGDPYSLSLRLDYVDIPVMLHFRDPWGGMILGLGVNYSRLVQQPNGKLLFNPNYFYPDTNDMQFLNNDLAVVADLRFTIWRGLQFNIRWQHSVIAVKREWTFTEIYSDTRTHSWDNDAYNNSLSFRLIWVF